MLSRRVLCLRAATAPLMGQPAMFSNAEAYERFMGRWSRFVAPLLVDFAGAIDSGVVLDVGSGTGALAFEIARKNTRVQVTGIDPSDEYISYASAHSPFPGRMVFKRGDAQALEFRSGSFAASMSLLVLNFIPDPAKALSEIRRVTRPGGRLCAAVWDYGDRMRMLRSFWDAAVRIDATAETLDEKHMPLCREGELTQLWKSGGLTEIREQPLEAFLKFRNFADYWDPFLLGQGPAGAYARKLKADRLQSLRDTLSRELAPRSELDAFELPARAWAVRGTVPDR